MASDGGQNAQWNKFKQTYVFQDGKLGSMGYPEQGSVAGLQLGLAQAKSMVSCAIGKVSG